MKAVYDDARVLLRNDSGTTELLVTDINDSDHVIELTVCLLTDDIKRGWFGDMQIFLYGEDLETNEKTEISFHINDAICTHVKVQLKSCSSAEFVYCFLKD